MSHEPPGIHTHSFRYNDQRILPCTVVFLSLLSVNLLSCPQPLTVYNRGHIKGSIYILGEKERDTEREREREREIYIYMYIYLFMMMMNIIQLFMSGARTQSTPTPAPHSTLFSSASSTSWQSPAAFGFCAV